MQQNNTQLGSRAGPSRRRKNEGELYVRRGDRYVCTHIGCTSEWPLESMRPHNVKSHWLTHNDLRRYACNVPGSSCRQRFARKSDLQIHLRNSSIHRGTPFDPGHIKTLTEEEMEVENRRRDSRSSQRRATAA
ncbi:hypothetical protein MJO29_006472 [Puccinia striiformis f. sp. tritici]|uniref:hypothetical protein n=1 Tax=Puccinia striiformis f. sp. tritici TaxID=168172 RepID=UPI002007FCE5|nr:hypothetical protein Pst134EA_011671 [Puccinia striiformis f. sp. tritici]KAH9468050.1 hypothetical protein Pst134EA_011671 [Puccinia striiformis f. sp. tritici]KAI7958255.1 hypothetical protein MJO29_006472 [Puccinia striiformis f. sp. tritici]KAI9608164.1 hypothetical protein KEM48_003431 [Puccinia striiformis f. sp. tritici PST-130]